jgi:hypothetical protein
LIQAAILPGSSGMKLSSSPYVVAKRDCRIT